VAVGIGLRNVQEALERKASAVQHEFIILSDKLQELGRLLLEADEEEKLRIREMQKELKAEQQLIAEDVNLWRNRARDVTRQSGLSSLKAYLKDLIELNEETITPAVQNALLMLETPPEERGFVDEQPILVQQSPAGRLLERSRTEFDLRSSDPGIRMKEAVTFANIPGMAQEAEILSEISVAMEDPDPLTRELAIFTAIQLYRFRALRLADLESAHTAVQQLAQIQHTAVIPVLIEILEQPRVGYIEEGGESRQADTSRSRMVALLKLVEWHTAEAQLALRKLKFDRDPHIVKAAQRALELFPEQWNGVLPDAKNQAESGQ
jgi:hypothetical protein